MPRIAVIDNERCNPQGCGNYLCIRLCPVNREGSDCIVKGPNEKPVIDETLCTGCGICPHRCPFDAIDIINLPEALSSKPVHRYGRNGFHLYNMPTPMFGKVVGILGKNGIGKSTAIKVLAGMLTPNLGQDEEASFDELLQYFKGSEAQGFFEKIRDGKITVGYKPQQVELISKTQKGKVKDLLKNIDEEGKFDSVTNELDLTNILDNDVSTLSGGELQRVAIAATVLKKANLYIFDEPTSYLDINQRIKVSKFIKNLAKEDIAVLVIEHDLIILDYMTDLVHIMYGKEGSYGIVSLPRSTKQGINTYLSGFLKEENMRFRSHQIKFDSRPPEKKGLNIELVSWTPLTKQLDNFTLNAKSGDIKKGEILGVLGENATGKTTFVKMLAGVMDIDKGETDEKIKVSYKSQYLDTESEELVVSFLGSKITKYENQFRNLNLHHLMNKQLNQLSGGELQRVAIAHALSQEADLYLLDEPSAYLDTEQRLEISKVIKETAENREVSVLVVDHDLLFMNYLSDRLMVFGGQPSVSGEVGSPLTLNDGMNFFLDKLNITMRRDKENNMPRINKPDSVMEREQKAKGNLYYA